MPNADTFSIAPIAAFIGRYRKAGQVIVDPFARNEQWATYTNDLNPTTKAQSHEDAPEWLTVLAQQGIRADLLVLDPPYSPRQVSECYASIGKKATMRDTQSRFYSDLRDAAAQCLKADATVLSFGWNSVGMGTGRGFEIVEIMLVCHGGAHNDTICLAEQRVAELPLDRTVPAPNIGGVPNKEGNDG
jgi:hypothetical protein